MRGLPSLPHHQRLRQGEPPLFVIEGALLNILNIQFLQLLCIYYILCSVPTLRERNPSIIMVLTTSHSFSSKHPCRTPVLAICATVIVLHLHSSRRWCNAYACVSVTDTEKKMGSPLLPVLAAKGNLSALHLTCCGRQSGPLISGTCEYVV